MESRKIIRYEYWLNLLQQWADRHGISTNGAASAIFNDGPHNTKGGVDLITKRDLFCVEADEFADMFLEQVRQARLRPNTFQRHVVDGLSAEELMARFGYTEQEGEELRQHLVEQGLIKDGE